MSVTAATIEANTIIKEWEFYGLYWLAYDWMKRMSCFAVRVMGLIRLELAVDVY